MIDMQDKYLFHYREIMQAICKACPVPEGEHCCFCKKKKDVIDLLEGRLDKDEAKVLFIKPNKKV